MKLFLNKKFISGFLLLLFYALLLRPTQNHAFSLSFVDEQDNFAIGDWLLRGKILYKDIFINHQPVPPILSAVIQKSTHPNSIFLLVKRHREMMLLISAISFILLTLRFGYPAFIMSILYELFKYILLGNAFLSESLSVFPVLYLTGILYELAVQKNKSLHKIDLFVIPLSLLGILFNLLPLTPFVAVSFLYILITIPKLQKKRLVITAIAITTAFLLFLSRFIDLGWYLHDNVLINILYFIPQEKAIPLVVTLGRIFLFPLLLFTQPHKDLYLLFQILSGAYILSLAHIIYQKKYLLALTSYLIVIMLNLRPLPLGEIYTGFHFLPLFSAFAFLTILQVKTVQIKIHHLVQNIGKILIYILFVLAAYSFGYRELIPQTNPASNWYINYSPFFDYGETLRLLSHPTDTLMIVPDAPLIYWQSRLFPSQRYYFVYGFIEYSPPLRKDVVSSLLKNPPTFIYIERDLYGYSMLAPFFKDYVQINHRNVPPRLYVRKAKLPDISNKQWHEVEKLGFSKFVPTPTPLPE